ncbi:signal peptidase I [Kineococcus sp. R8]|uniref:signal peptidase I n=1 Tax=Kineococcus siccus TaxID=2696567 RepID=UPI001412B1E0|nr:signal peptidase I [Kineococcus siccus]NAZ84108.1 signal peptidase I [Kineococcus siccus]
MTFHTGNADADGAADGGWLVGGFKADHAPELATADVEVKWARLAPGSRDDAWTDPEPQTSLTVLVSGGQTIRFRSGGEAVLRQSGDYVIWYPGESHTWEASATQETTTITVRWPSSVR